MPTLFEIRETAARIVEELIGECDHRNNGLILSREQFEYENGRKGERIIVSALGDSAAELAQEQIVSGVQLRADLHKEGIGLVVLGVQRKWSTPVEIYCGAGVDINRACPDKVSDRRVEDREHPVNVFAQRVLEGIGDIIRSKRRVLVLRDHADSIRTRVKS